MFTSIFEKLPSVALVRAKNPTIVLPYEPIEREIKLTCFEGTCAISISCPSKTDIDDFLAQSDACLGLKTG